MDELSTLVGGLRVSTAEQAAMVCTQVRSLEAERTEVLEEAERLSRLVRKAGTSKERVCRLGEVQALRKRARKLYSEIDEETARQTKIRETAV